MGILEVKSFTTITFSSTHVQLSSNLATDAGHEIYFHADGKIITKRRQLFVHVKKVHGLFLHI